MNWLHTCGRRDYTSNVARSRIRPTAQFMAEWGDRLGSPEYYPEVSRLWPPLVSAAVTAVADAPEGGVLIHCMAGRDRTSMVTAILLELVCADRDAIFADFAQSATEINAWWRIHGGPKGSRTDTQMVEYLADARTSLNEFLHGIDTARYLLDSGVSSDQLARVRSRLLGD